MEDSFLYDFPVPEMIDDDPFQELLGDSRVPYALRIHDEDRPAGAHPEARGLPALDSAGAKQQPLALQ
jgi:hypothetical protein